MIKDYAKLAMKNLRKRKLRSWLTIVGIVISVAIIFTLISLSLGLREAINEQFKILGTDNLFIMPQGQAGTGVSPVSLTTEDVKVIEKVNGVKDISYATVGSAQVEFGKQKKFFMVVGLPMEKMNLYINSANLKMNEGNYLKEKEIGKVMIG
jgi:putative ABC transport system permease protein